MDFVVFHQSELRNGNPPYDPACPGLHKKPIFTYSENTLTEGVNSQRINTCYRMAKPSLYLVKEV